LQQQQQQHCVAWRPNYSSGEVGPNPQTSVAANGDWVQSVLATLIVLSPLSDYPMVRRAAQTQDDAVSN